MCPLPLAHAETLMCCRGSCPGASGQPAEAYTLPGQDNVLGSNIKHEAGPVQPRLLHSAGLRLEESGRQISSSFGEVA